MSADLPLLLAALARVPAAAWQPHFNSAFYQGTWSGVALISPSDAPSVLAPGQGEPVETRHWQADPAWQQALAPLQVDIRSARLLKLRPGSHIEEHCDYDLGGEGADRRLHIPLLSPPGVEFVLQGQQVPMSAGECWFLDLARPHSLDHCGVSDRVHLVLDCRPNLWLDRQIEAGLATTPSLGTGHALCEFLRLQALLEREPALSTALQSITDRDTFITHTVALAGAHGIDLLPATLRAAMREGRSRWNRQWTH